VRARPRAHDRTDRLRVPSRGTESRRPREPNASTCPKLTDPTRAECLRMPEANRPRASQSVPARADRPRMPRPMRLSHFPSLLSYLALVSAISGFVEPFDYSELNHFSYSELSHFNYNELSHFSYRAQSFYDFVSHSATVSSGILLENSVIHHCYSTQSFLLHCSAFCVLLQ
jgi:hypothetical protein